MRARNAIAQSPEQSDSAPAVSVAADLWECTKPGIALFNVITAAGAFYLASPGPIQFPAFACTLVSVWLLVAGSCSLNNYLERDVDRLMDRTRNRALPSGRIAPTTVFVLGLLLVIAGLGIMFAGVNTLATSLGALAVGSYVFLYTPLKRRTAMCTVVGGIPGALPPVMGWAAARGELDFGAFILFCILFLWQLPHFLAIGWMYREDYAKAGMPMLTVNDAQGTMTVRQTLVYSIALLAASVFPSVLGLTGLVYFIVVGLVGFANIALIIWWFAMPMERARARAVFFASLLHLVTMFALMILDKTPR